MPLERFFPYRLAVVADALSRQLAAVYGAEHRLSREEWRVLFLLEDAGQLDSLRLAQRTTLDKVQVSRSAARLEAKGLITRAVSGTDRRLRVYAITEAGRVLFQAAFGKVAARTNEILSAMPDDDRAALERGLSALGAALGKGHPPGDGPA